MDRSKIEETVRACITRVAKEQGIPLKALELHHTIVEDLGFKSLDVATLTAFLESEFNVDPFSMGVAAITEIRTFGDVCAVYDKCINGNSASATSDDTEAFESKRLARRRAS